MKGDARQARDPSAAKCRGEDQCRHHSRLRRSRKPQKRLTLPHRSPVFAPAKGKSGKTPPPAKKAPKRYNGAKPAVPARHP